MCCHVITPRGSSLDQGRQHRSADVASLRPTAVCETQAEAFANEPDPSAPIEETVRAMHDMVNKGKVRYIGVSTMSAWLLMKALWSSGGLDCTDLRGCRTRIACSTPATTPRSYQRAVTSSWATHRSVHSLVGS